MVRVEITPYKLNFKIPAGTSRGVLNDKTSYIVKITENGISGYGEAGPLPKLSIDFDSDFVEIINSEFGQSTSISKIEETINSWNQFPSLRFAFETALLDLKKGGTQKLFNTDFTEKSEGIKINGLIWMGDVDFMLKQISEKLDSGFSCLKMKIGAINFEQELIIIKQIRNCFSPDSLELRVDANGAFDIETALSKLEMLSKFNIHSIEQPIKQGNIKSMAELCNKTPFPIALDEELIGIVDHESLLKAIKPQYIILKPSLLGGFKVCDSWISHASKNNIGWWVTSALESNVGLNAIAQYTSTFDLTMPQGLGTGSLYTNNINSPLEIKGENLFYNKNIQFSGLESF